MPRFTGRSKFPAPYPARIVYGNLSMVSAVSSCQEPAAKSTRRSCRRSFRKLARILRDSFRSTIRLSRAGSAQPNIPTTPQSHSQPLSPAESGDEELEATSKDPNLIDRTSADADVLQYLMRELGVADTSRISDSVEAEYETPAESSSTRIPAKSSEKRPGRIKRAFKWLLRHKFGMIILCCSVSEPPSGPTSKSRNHTHWKWGVFNTAAASNLQLPVLTASNLIEQIIFYAIDFRTDTTPAPVLATNLPGNVPVNRIYQNAHAHDNARQVNGDIRVVINSINFELKLPNLTLAEGLILQWIAMALAERKTVTVTATSSTAPTSCTTPSPEATDSTATSTPDKSRAGAATSKHPFSSTSRQHRDGSDSSTFPSGSKTSSSPSPIPCERPSSNKSNLQPIHPRPEPTHLSLTQQTTTHRLQRPYRIHHLWARAQLRTSTILGTTSSTDPDRTALLWDIIQHFGVSFAPVAVGMGIESVVVIVPGFWAARQVGFVQEARGGAAVERVHVGWQ